VFTQDWIEAKTERLLRRARASQYWVNILADAKQIEAEGFVFDVALMKSLRYWVGCPITGHVSGVEVP
jgi:hypothetical protein